VDVGWLVGVVVGSGGEIVAGVGGAVGDDE
jgi:hypothetical protein